MVGPPNRTVLDCVARRRLAAVMAFSGDGDTYSIEITDPIGELKDTSDVRLQELLDRAAANG